MIEVYKVESRFFIILFLKENYCYYFVDYFSVFFLYILIYYFFLKIWDFIIFIFRKIGKDRKE